MGRLGFRGVGCSFTVALTGVALIASACSGQVEPADSEPRFEMPDAVAWTAYDVGSAGYNQASSIGDAMSAHEGVTMRVIPAGTDVARQSPVAAGRAQFGALGLGGTLLAQEGIMEFGETEWGPQEVRLLGAAWADSNTGTVSCAGDAGVETVYDLEGKRIAWVVDAPGLNLNMTSFLAAADLGWEDVERVEFPSWGASGRAIVSGESDCFIGGTNAGLVYELAGSPRGHQPVHMPYPDEDPEAWERLGSVAPYWEFNEATVGAPPVSEETPHVGATYGYPAVVTYAERDEELVYEQTRMLYELLEEYVEAFPGNEGFALEEQKLEWVVVPYHEGAVRYFDEAGVWNEELQEHNESLVERQEVLAAAWEETLDRSTAEEVPSEEFPELWMDVRVEALREAGLEPYWEEIMW